MSQLKFKERSKALLARLIDTVKAVKYSFWIMLVGLGLMAGSLGGCKATLPTKVLPPVELIQDCPESAIDVTTNGGLAKAVPILRSDIVKCNIDKAALRAWAEDK